MFWAIMIALLIAVLMGYFKGVKQEKPWGKPLLTVATIALVIVVGYKVSQRHAPKGNIGSATGRAENMAALIGQGLKGHLEERGLPLPYNRPSQCFQEGGGVLKRIEGGCGEG